MACGITLFILTSIIILNEDLNSLERSETPKAQTKQTLQSLPALFLPGPGQGSATNPNFQFTGQIDTLPTQVPVYKFKKINVTSEMIRNTAAKLGITGKVKELSNTGINALTITSGEKYLEIHKNSGKLVYLNRKHLNSIEVNGTKKVIPTNEESIDHATAFLNKMGWLPDNFEVAGVTPTTMARGDQNPELDQGNILNKRVHYYKHINGQRVYGVSRIIVSVGHRGEIETVKKYYKQHNLFGIYPLKTIDRAIKDFENSKGIHDIEPEGKNPVITDVEISYW